MATAERAGRGTRTATGTVIEPTVEQRLLLSIAAWSAWSTGVGAVLWRVGRRGGGRSLGDAGRTTLAWGLADAAVAGWGAWRGRRAGRAGAPGRERRMALVTGANAVLDVGYVAAGVRLASGRRRGDGVAITVQGLFLLYLDTRYCLEFAASSRTGPGSAVGPSGTGARPAASRLGPCTRPAPASPQGRDGPRQE